MESDKIELEVDINALEKQASDLSACADSFRNIKNRLIEICNSTGWSGGDATGFINAANTVIGNIDNLVSMIDTTSHQMHDAVYDYRQLR